MTTSSESDPDSLTPQAIVGPKSLILDPDEVHDGTHANIPQYVGKTEGDVITLSWESDSGPTFSTRLTVNADNAKVPIPVKIAYQPYIIDNLGNIVSVIYEVKRINGRTATARALSFLIKRQLAESLVAPMVLEASGSVLDPMKALSGATALVSYQGMRDGDCVSVFWNGEKVEPSKQVVPGDTFVDIKIPVSMVAASLGKSIIVHYEVARGSNLGVKSHLLALDVGQLSEDDLPTPTVPEASDGTLDLRCFEGDGSVTVSLWPLIAQGQRYWISVQGTLEDGTAYRFYLVRGGVVSEANLKGGVAAVWPRSEIENFKDNGEVTIMAGVNFDGSVEEGRASSFPLGVVKLVKAGVVRVEDFESLPVHQVYNPGETVELPEFTFSVSGSSVKVSDGYQGVSGKYLELGVRAIVTVTFFNQPKLFVGYADLNMGGLLCKAYDNEGAEIPDAYNDFGIHCFLAPASGWIQKVVIGNTHIDPRFYAQFDRFIMSY